MLIHRFSAKMLSHSPQTLVLLFLPITIFILFIRDHRSNRWLNDQVPAQFTWTDREPQRGSSLNTTQPDPLYDPSFEGASRVMQVTMQYGGEVDLTAERALKTHMLHGEKWGYPMHILRSNILGNEEDSDRVWSKLLYIQSIMVHEMTKPFGKRTDWLVWFDSDTVLTNLNIPWTIFLPPSEDKFASINLLITTDWFGFNAGVFLIRVCEWSVKLLADAIALPRLRPESDLPYAEQTALQIMYDEEKRLDHRLYVPRHWFNVYDDKNAPEGEVTYPGSMLIHFPALSGRRLEAMGVFLDQLEREEQKLQLPIENTTYLGETDAYWGRLHDAYENLKDAREYEEEVKNNNESVYKHYSEIFNKVHMAEDLLRKVIRESAFAKGEMRQRTLELGQQVYIARTMMNKVLAKEEGKEVDEDDGEEKKEEEEGDEKKHKEGEEEYDGDNNNNKDGESKEKEGAEDEYEEGTASTSTEPGKPIATPIHDEDGESVPQSPGG